MATRLNAKTLSIPVVLALCLSALTANSAAAEPSPSSGAELIAAAQQRLDALNERVDKAVEDFDEGQLKLAQVSKSVELAQVRVTRSQQKLAALQRDRGSLAAAAYRGGTADHFITLISTSSPQTFLDRANALDQISRKQREQRAELRAADRELRASEQATERQLKQQRSIAAKLASARAGIEKDVAEQKTLVGRLVDAEAKRVAAEREAARRRRIALAAARVERARLARIEAERKVRVAAEAEARLQRAGREQAASRLAAQRAVREREALDAERERQAAAAEAAAADAAPQDPPPAPVTPPAPEPSPAPPADGGGDRGAIAVRAAYAQLGKPYVWAADGPDTFDCSGLTLFAWAKAGVSLPHSSRAQFNEGRHVGRGELRPGDLVFYGSPIHHVGMYIGVGNTSLRRKPATSFGSGASTGPIGPALSVSSGRAAGFRSTARQPTAGVRRRGPLPVCPPVLGERWWAWPLRTVVLEFSG
ncbi:MAG: NlpC/P60 family protein [Actinomycetota bacterium]